MKFYHFTRNSLEDSIKLSGLRPHRVMSFDPHKGIWLTAKLDDPNLSKFHAIVYEVDLDLDDERLVKRDEARDGWYIYLGHIPFERLRVVYRYEEPEQIPFKGWRRIWNIIHKIKFM